jgi:cell division protein FtsL
MLQCEIKGEKIMYTVMVVGIIIVIIVLLLAVLTTSKAYTYKHTVDSLEDNPYINEESTQQEQEQTKP